MSKARLVGRINLAAAIVGTSWLLLPVRVTNPELNQVVALCAILGVLITFGVASAILPKYFWLRSVCAFSCFALSILFPVVLVLSMLGGGPISGYETLDAVVLEHSTVKAYRTNGGATTDYGISISQEMPLLPGIVLVKDIHRGYHESEATLSVVGSGIVAVKINNREAIEYRVKSFVYF